jgi:septum formation protein
MHYMTDLDISTVFFKTLTRRQIEHYVDIEKPYDCAGSFKSESLGIALFEKIQGDDPNALTGLPLIKLISLLEKFGVYVL